MKKKWISNYHPRGNPMKMLFGIFSKSLLLIICLSFFLNVQLKAQSGISLNLVNASVKEVLDKIKEQSKYTFIYNEEDVATLGKRSLSIKDAEIKTVLDRYLSGTGFSYVIKGSEIVIRKNPVQNERKKITLSGKVRDEFKNPLSDVSIVVKGTQTGTATSPDGSYKLEINTNTPVILRFSFIGMETKEFVCENDAELNVTLRELTSEMGAVVVTGIFDRNVESFTGSSSTISRKELLKAGNQNIIQSLRNIDPALNISENLTNGSDPNRMPDMQLRGVSSFPDVRGQYLSNPNLPLFILDGFETSVEKVMDLDINRIETVTILKDASAKAIYGSKAANGVIVIETIKVKPGELKISYNGTLNLEMPDLTSYNMCNATEKLELERILGAYNRAQPIIDLQYKELYYKILKEVQSGVNTDWMAQPLRNGIGRKHSLSVEAGDDKLRAGISLFNNVIEGVMKGSGRNNLGGGFSLIYRHKKLLFRNILQLSVMKSSDSPYGTFNEYVRLNPYWRNRDEDGNIIKYLGIGPVISENVYNPMFNATINTKSTNDYLDITNNTYLEYTFNSNLKLVGRFGFSNKTVESEKFYPGSHTKFVNYNSEMLFLKGSYDKGHGKSLALSSDINLNYSKSWRKHVLFGNIGANIREENSENYIYSAIGFPNDKMDNIIFAKQYAQNAKPTGYESINREVGALMAVNYSYDDRFLSDFSLRTSASSQFGSNNRWGSFWSFGLGWNIHNESFLKNSEVIRQLRIRSSVGYTGSQNFNSYQAMLLYNYFVDDSYQGMIGTYLEGLANNDLKWQQKLDYNYGLDLNIKNRINLKFDYYRSITDNLLTDITVPPSLGFDYYKANLGQILNTGMEFRLNYNVFVNSEKRSSLNLFVLGASNKNKIMKISNSLRGLTEEQDKLSASSNKPFVRFQEGQSLTAIWGVKSNGIDPATGKEIYVKPDGTLIDVWSANDKVVCGDSQAKLTGNFGFNLEHKGFSLSLICRFRMGGQIYNQTLVDKVENAQLNYNVDKRAYYDSWKNPGDVVLFKNIGNYLKPTLATSRFVQDLNELDVASVNIGYDFYKFPFIKKLGLERLQLFMNMNDLIKFSTVKIERGTSYPFARYCSFSVVANF